MLYRVGPRPVLPVVPVRYGETEKAVQAAQVEADMSKLIIDVQTLLTLDPERQSKLLQGLHHVTGFVQRFDPTAPSGLQPEPPNIKL